MKIKIIIDGAEGMEDAARRIADLMDAVETIRYENRQERQEKEYQERRKKGLKEQARRAIAEVVVRSVFAEMKEKEKSPAEGSAGDGE